jgi:hypothetical protein
VSGAWVEQGVGVVHEAEEHGQRLFQVDERRGMLGSGHLLLLVVGSRMAPFYSQTTQQTSSGGGTEALLSPRV